MLVNRNWKSIVKLTAKQVLYDYKILNCPADHLTQILQGEGIVLIELNLNIDDDSCGLYCEEAGEKEIYINSNMGEGRRNFTIAHELGHYFLNHELNDYCRLFRDLQNMDHKKDPQEVEANYFAACLLMPSDLVLKVFNSFAAIVNRRLDTALCIDSNPGDIKDLRLLIHSCQENFKVSKRAAFYRLINLKLLKVGDDFKIDLLYS